MKIEWLRPWEDVARRNGWTRPERINVVGKTGSGKTTLAGAIAARTDIPHIEMDAHFWGPDWTPVPRDQFITTIQHAVAQPRWVIDGNYNMARPFIIPHLQLLVWLDYPLALSMWQLTRRGVARIVTQEDLWGTGNRESARKMFASRESLYIWAVKSHRKLRRRYLATVDDPAYAHVAVVRLRSRRATQQWLEEFIAHW